MISVPRTMQRLQFLHRDALYLLSLWHLCWCSLETNIYIKTGTTVAEVDDKFLSVTIDSGIIRHRWKDWDFGSVRLRTLAAGLSPCYMRLGGTDADFLVFDPNKRDTKNHLGSWEGKHMKVRDMQLDSCDGWKYCKPKNTTKYTMSASDWDSINEFSVDVGWRMLFDFNVLLSNGSNWSPVNAKLLLKYTNTKSYARNIDFELGNEPNAFHHNFNRTISGHQLGEDFLVLRNLKKQYNFSRSCLVGPDTTRPTRKHSKSLKFLKEFLPVAGEAIHAITWHQYYLNGRTAIANNFTDPAVLDLLTTQIHRVKNVVHHAKLGDKRIWLGETSSAFGGGARGLSDSYIAGFMWLDKLGLAARQGINIVMRQSFVRGHYALLDDDLEPRPDYWLSLLFKLLVGKKVLNVSSDDTSGKIRLYAHCTAISNRTLVPKYGPGATTLYGMNLNDEDLTITSLVNVEVHQYLLTPHTEGKLTSHLVRLNKKKLKMLDDRTFPQLPPLVLKPREAIVIPAKTFGFFVIPDARAHVCI